ncbi:MAG: PaaI family thioesterase [SAR324 cluster bacterium]|nr:PaaI family thioesterase [SAR324 cluster bacterium]
MTAIPGGFPAGYSIADPEDTFELGAGPFYCPDDADGDPRIVMLAEPRHINATGVIHGGLLMTMADLAICYTARQGYPEERAITVSMNSDFVDSGKLGDFVEARAEVVRRTGSFVFMRAQIAVEGRVLLNCGGVVKRIKLK